MEEVIVLGSGTPIAEQGRGGSAVAVVAESSWVLVDCGRAATQRAIDVDLDLTKVAAVALTHHHSDHIGDLATFATVRWTSGATSPLVVLAPRGPAAEFARCCLDAYDDQSFYGQASPDAGPRPTIDVCAFDPSSDVSQVYAVDGWHVSSVLVDHHPIAPAVGYRIERADHRAVVSGDTAVCDGMRRLAEGTDVLVHEAIRSDSSPDLLAWNASARDVGALAADVTPSVVVLTHMIPAPASWEDEDAYADEARSYGFDGPVVLARDLLRVPLVDR